MPTKKNTTRADGRIAVQVYLGCDENGKRKYKTVYGSTQKDADEKADTVKAMLRKGLNITTSNNTFNDWADLWITVKSTEASFKHIRTYNGLLAHFRAAFGDVPISKIRQVDIQNVIISNAAKNPNTNKPAAKKTLHALKSTVVQIFQLAIENRIIDYNPAQNVKIPANAPQDKRRALTDEEQKWITDTEHRAKPAAMIMMYAGLRRGELIPLMWRDIDLDEHTITVNKSVEVVNNQFIVKDGAKTAAGERVIDIPGVLVEYLKNLKNEPRNGLYVCVNAKGFMHTDTSWRRMWDSYLLDLNIKYGDFSGYMKAPKSKYDPAGVPFVIPRITPHWLRHTYATLLYFAGVDVMTARDQMGHADIKTLLDIYTHLDKLHKRKAMSKLDEYLNDASQDASQNTCKTLYP